MIPWARFHERSDPPDRGDPERSWVTLGRNSVPQTILTPRINDPEWSWLTLPLGRDHSGSLWLNMAANWFLCWYLPRQVARWPFSERHRLILSKLGQSTMVTLNLVRILCSFMIIQMLFRNFNGHTQQRPMSVCCVQWYWYPSPCSRPCKHGKHQRLRPLMLRIALGRAAALMRPIPPEAGHYRDKSAHPMDARMHPKGVRDPCCVR